LIKILIDYDDIDYTLKKEVLYTLINLVKSPKYEHIFSNKLFELIDDIGDLPDDFYN
jgi:hypothetical protein